MRNIIFVLVLLNFLVFAYQHWVLAPDTEFDAFRLEEEVPGLTLVNPVPAEADPDLPALQVDSAVGDVATVNLADNDSAPVEAQRPADRCLKLGPFSRIADAADVRKSLEDRGMTVSQTTEEGQVWMGHWVQVVDLPSPAAAEEARAVLADGGITDVYVLPNDPSNRISLGVFRLRSSASRLVKQAFEMGLNTRVDDRYQPGSNHWLRVRMAGDSNLKPGEFKGDAGQIVRTETIACPRDGI